MNLTCTCNGKFRDPESWRDHMPCPGTPFERLHAAVVAYVDRYGVEHEDDCPEDDTCECPLVQALNKALAKGD